MYRNVRKNKQRKHDQFAQSLIFNSPKPETTKQRLLRERADAIIERAHGATGSKHFERNQRQERDRRFYASREWFEFRFNALKHLDYSCKCGRECGIKHVRLIKPLSTHWHLRMNLTNVMLRCDVCARPRPPRKRERL